MNDQMKKELQHFLASAERLVSDVQSKMELAKYLLVEAEKGSSWLPSFPANLPAGLLDVQASMAVLNHLQTAESLMRAKLANPYHPMPKGG